MRLVIQRVSRASVTIEGEKKSEIGRGLLVLVGIEDGETLAKDQGKVQWMAGKVARMRIFEDDEGKMNLSVNDVGGEVLIVSQFTLYGDAVKGNRPSFIKAARPEHAIPMYESFIEEVRKLVPAGVGTGEFGADMKVELLNDGPVTIIIEN